MLIEGLATQLDLVRRARVEARANPASAAVAKEIESSFWNLAVEFAKDLMLPEEALKRIVWLN
jgi:hypothetical protein